MGTLRTQMRSTRQSVYFNPEINPRAEAVTLFVGAPQSPVSATVIITQRIGHTSRDDATGVIATANGANILINKAEVATLPDVRDGFRGTCTTEDGIEWRLGDILYEDDALFRVQAKRTVIVGAGKHRAMPWGA
jgi:hypothetical protein